MTPLLTGFVLGVAGSGHCMVMCGPLVLTIGRSLRPPSRRVELRHSLLYHGGRVLTYVALAIPAGVVGQTLALRGFGRALAIAAGLLLLASALGAVSAQLLGPPGRLSAAAASRACAAANTWCGSHPVTGPVVSGAANGLVPCGLVYAAVTAAAAMGTAADAVLLMIGFGLGTAPALVALSLSAASLPLGFRLRLRRLTPVVLALTAALLLIRGIAWPSSSPHHQHVSSTVRR